MLSIAMTLKEMKNNGHTITNRIIGICSRASLASI